MDTPSDAPAEVLYRAEAYTPEKRHIPELDCEVDVHDLGEAVIVQLLGSSSADVCLQFYNSFKEVFPGRPVLVTSTDRPIEYFRLVRVDHIDHIDRIDPPPPLLGEPHADAAADTDDPHRDRGMAAAAA